MRIVFRPDQKPSIVYWTDKEYYKSLDSLKYNIKTKILNVNDLEPLQLDLTEEGNKEFQRILEEFVIPYTNTYNKNNKLVSTI